MNLSVAYFIVSAWISGDYHQVGHYCLIPTSHVTQFMIIFTLLPTLYISSWKSVIKQPSNESRTLLYNSRWITVINNMEQRLLWSIVTQLELEGSLHWILSQASWTPSHPHTLTPSHPHTLTPHFFKTCFNIILSFIPRSDGRFSLCFLTKIFYTFLISFMRATCSVHVILLYLITINNIWWKVKLLNK
jgi:hypothetical protein